MSAGLSEHGSGAATTPVVLVRHTAVAAPAGLCYGNTDVALAAFAAADIEAVRARMPWPIGAADRVVSSPARRCTALASALAGGAGTDERLTEIDFGRWQGRQWADIARHELDAWNTDLADAAPPGGESLRTVAARAGAALREALASRPRRLVVVTHGGVVRALLAELIGLDLRHAGRLHVALGGIAVLEMSRAGCQLRQLNR